MQISQEHAVTAASYETDVLISLIEQKRLILSRLMELIQRQWRIIENEDYGQLLGVLASKQPLLSQLQENEKRIAPFREQDADSRVWRTPEHRLSCRENAQTCQDLLTQVMTEEKRCEQHLIAQREQTRDMLDRTAKASHAHRAYRTSQPRGASQLDLMSQE